MAEQGSQESTLQSVLDQLKSNADSGGGETKEIVDEIKKQRSDFGKTHQKRDKSEKAANDKTAGFFGRIIADAKWMQKFATKTAAGAAAVEGKSLGFLKGMAGHFNWSRKFQERIAKNNKTLMSQTIQFGKDKIDAVKKSAVNMLDLLKKGLGLAVLWGLFKWLSQADWTTTIEKVKGWIESINLEWDDVVAVLDGIWIVLTRMSGLWIFSATMNLIKGWFSMGGPVGTLFKFMLGFGFRAMFLAGGAIWEVLKWIGSIFGKEGGFLSNQLKAIKESAKFTQWFGPESKFQSIIKWVKGLFGAEGKIAGHIKTIKESAKFQKWFGPESKIQGIFKWIGGFFGSADEGGKIAKALQAIKNNKVIAGIGKFLGGIGGKMLKMFGPIGWLIAGYDAVMAFWEAFQSEEGSLWDKTVAGLSAGIQAIVDFFVFDMIGLAEKGVKWLIKKVMGLFGMDEAKVEKSEWFKFSITGFLQKTFGEMMTIFKGILKMDPKMILDGLKGLYGKSADIIGWLFDIAIKPAINGIAKALGFADEGEDLISKEFNLGTWIKEKLLDPIFEFLGKLFTMDFAALAKSIMPEWLYNLFAGGEAKKVKKDLEGLGILDDRMGRDDILDTEKLKTMIEGHKGKGEQKALANKLAVLMTDDDIREEDKERLKTLLAGYGAELNKGGFIPAGKVVPAVLHGPELVQPVPDLKSASGLGGGAPTIVNAPTSNVSSGSTTVAMPSSSINPMNEKYFRMA